MLRAAAVKLVLQYVVASAAAAPVPERRQSPGSVQRDTADARNGMLP